MAKTVVVALGGNALLRSGHKGTVQEHLLVIDRAAEHIAQLINKGFNVIVTHGNGPQVGNILLQQEKARDYAPQMPLYVCVAESQGMIGYMLQEALYNKLHAIKINIPVVTVVTQVLVNENDPAFKNPTKPIGPFYPDKSRIPNKKWKVTRTIKGYRRVVPSPKPKEIIEAKEIKKIARDAVVIACGGGGVPVIKKKGLIGVDAVIDKDRASAKLAKAVGAERLIILTDVEHAFINYKKPKQKTLGKVTVSEIREYYKQGHFAKGSMGPKIQSAVQFIENGGKMAVISHLDNLEEAIYGDCGTVIVPDKKK